MAKRGWCSGGGSKKKYSTQGALRSSDELIGRANTFPPSRLTRVGRTSTPSPLGNSRCPQVATNLIHLPAQLDPFHLSLLLYAHPRPNLLYYYPPLTPPKYFHGHLWLQSLHPPPSNCRHHRRATGCVFNCTSNPVVQSELPTSRIATNTCDIGAGSAIFFSPAAPEASAAIDDALVIINRENVLHGSVRLAPLGFPEL